MKDRDTKFEHLRSMRILSHYREIQWILLGEIPWPRIAMIYPYQGCNLACSYCEYIKENTKPHRRMDFSVIKANLDILMEKGLESIEFCGGGEPLLHPELLDFSQYLKERGLSLGILTNGMKFDPSQAADWVRAFSYIRFSLDAATPETFEKVKGAPAEGFNRVRENIKAMIRAVASTKAPCEVSIKACLTPDNVMEIQQMVALAQELGVDSMAFKAARNTPMELSAELIKGAQENILALKAKSNGENPQIFGGVEPSRIDQQCILTPLNITIDSDGKIYLCHYFYHRKQNHQIGNMADPIETIWGASRHREAIENISPNECNIFDCRFHTYNRIARKVMTKGSLKFL